MIPLSAPSPLPSPPLPALSPSHLRSKSLFSSSFLSPSSNQWLRSVDSHLHISLLLSIWVGPKMVLITCHLDYYNSSSLPTFQVFPGGSDGKASAYNAGDLGSIPESWRSPGEGNGDPLHWKFLPGEFHGQRSLSDYSPWGCKELDTTEQLTCNIILCN